MTKTQSELLVAEAVKKNIPVLHPDIFHSAPGDEIDLNAWKQLPDAKIANGLAEAAERFLSLFKPMTKDELKDAHIVKRP